MKNTLRKTLSLFWRSRFFAPWASPPPRPRPWARTLTSKGTLLNQKTQLSTNVF